MLSDYDTGKPIRPQHPLTNTGLIVADPSPTDWIAGANSKIVYKVVLKDGAWRKYAPNGEDQYNRFFDTMACVSFSLLDCVEAQLRQQGIEVNLSDRFLAKMSGTTSQGNSLQRVADTLRLRWDVTENRWAFSGDFNWDKYYAEIAGEVIAEALAGIRGITLEYDFLPIFSDADLRYYLKQSPLQVTVHTGNGWNQEHVPVSAGVGDQNHAVALLEVLEDGTRVILDHYYPYIKFLAPGYTIFAKLRPVITTNMNQAKVVKSKTSQTVWVCYPVSSPEYLKTKGELEGFTVPADSEMPNTDSLI